MRHGDKINNLGRKKAHRKALMSNLTCQLIEHKGITTTLAKAKALRPYAEPLLHRGKSDNMHNRRVVFSYLQDKEAIKELFGNIGDKIASRPGGYTRIIKLPRRMGDAADMAYIELVDFNTIYNPNEERSANAAKKTRRGRAKSAAKTTIATEPIEAPEVAASSNEEPAAKDAIVPDDLTLIEGIGPAVAALFNENGVSYFSELAALSVEDMQAMLDKEEGKFNAQNPATWAEQAQMAAEGKWDELKAWQDEHKGGLPAAE